MLFSTEMDDFIFGSKKCVILLNKYGDCVSKANEIETLSIWLRGFVAVLISMNEY